MVDERVALAAHNNADLYEAIFTAHGIPYERSSFAFVAGGRPPPFYSDITTLSPTATDEILARVEAMVERTGGRLAVKDAFDRLDLAALGFELLFTAWWIWRPPTGDGPPPGWRPVESNDELGAWEAAWKASSPTDHHMFPAALLDDPAVTFWAGWRGDRIVAGCLANASGDCVGLSNVFAEGPTATLWAAAAAAAGSTVPRLPTVGYERGVDLAHAEAAGFAAVGSLRAFTAAAGDDR
ncbi:MAG: hypothetical protein AAF962_20940 [Actinomycetota bacterium]